MKPVLVAWDHNSVPPDILFKLPTYIGFAETDLPLKSSLILAARDNKAEVLSPE